MNAAQPESQSSGADAEVSAAELHCLASQLDVYRRERLAYTDIPARSPKSLRPASDRLKNFLAAVSCWVIARC